MRTVHNLLDTAYDWRFIRLKTLLLTREEFLALERYKRSEMTCSLQAWRFQDTNDFLFLCLVIKTLSRVLLGVRRAIGLFLIKGSPGITGCWRRWATLHLISYEDFLLLTLVISISRWFGLLVIHENQISNQNSFVMDACLGLLPFQRCSGSRKLQPLTSSQFHYLDRRFSTSWRHGGCPTVLR